MTSITKKKKEGNKGSPCHRPCLAMKNEEELAFTNKDTHWTKWTKTLVNSKH